MSSKAGQIAGQGLGYGHVASSLLLIFPLWIAYELGLLITPANNGVDFLSRVIFDLAQRDAQQYLYVHLALGGLYLALLTWLWRRSALALEQVTPMLLESAIYALTLGSLIIFVMDRLMGLPLLAMGAPEIGKSLVISLGAGVHEELIFRLLLMGLCGVLLTRILGSRRLAIALAALGSALLFALAHHFGAGGETFTLTVFVYRAIAGLVFAAIFYYRSLAHAVYSHFLYDFYVLVIA
jgi:membrane protease YdiL (CAAX protease family)